MNKELNILKAKSETTSNNRAGGLYKKALLSEMRSTSEKYKDQINIEKLKLKYLQNKNNN